MHDFIAISITYTIVIGKIEQYNIFLQLIVKM